MPRYTGNSTTKFPEIRKEYDKVKILAVNVGIPMYLMTNKKAVKSLDDLKGMRIRVTGDAMMRTFKTLGAEPVGMPVVEMLESFQKGIIQGVIFAHGDYKSLKLAEAVKFETENFIAGPRYICVQGHEQRSLGQTSRRCPEGFRCQQRLVW